LVLLGPLLLLLVLRLHLVFLLVVLQLLHLFLGQVVEILVLQQTGRDLVNTIVRSSVVDLDPEPDPHVFWPDPDPYI
jgi:hypothetical protein